MHLRELRIRAMDGSVIVDGVLRLETDEPAAATLPSRELRFIGVNLPEARFGGPSFQLFNEIQRAKDGFWGASAPLLTVHFEEGMLDIQRLLTRGLKSQRFEIHDELRVGSVAVRYPRVNAGDWRDLYGHVRSLQLSLAVENDGLRISFNAPVEPMAFREEAPVFTRARLIGDVLVPSEYWRIRGMAGAMWAAQNNARVGEWSPDTAPLGAAAFGEYGEHFSSGRLDWGQPADDLYPPGQFVGVRLSPHQMTLRSAGELSLLANGFASRRHHHSGGPELTLFLGSDDWARIFEIKDEAELELRGAVAGHLDGRTGRDAYEQGPRRQALASVTLAAWRSREGLWIEGRGELGPLQDGEGLPLGPTVHFDVMIPRAWFLSRGIGPRRFWEEWKRDYPSAASW